MSFNDVGRGGARRTSVNGGGSSDKGGTVFRSLDPLDQISDAIINLQKSCNQLKDRITEARRKKASAADKYEIDAKLQEIRASESKVKIQMDNESRKLENIPRTEAAPKRVTLSKLQKDYDRIKVSIQALSSESSMIRVTADVDTKPSAASNNSYSNSGSSNNSNDDDDHGGSGKKFAEPQLIEIQGQDVVR